MQCGGGWRNGEQLEEEKTMSGVGFRGFQGGKFHIPVARNLKATSESFPETISLAEPTIR